MTILFCLVILFLCAAVAFTAAAFNRLPTYQDFLVETLAWLILAIIIAAGAYFLFIKLFPYAT